MASPPADTAGGAALTGRSLKRLEFEMALEIGDTGDRPLAETVNQAVHAAGGDLLCLLPAPDGGGMTAVVRLLDDGRSHFIQVRSAEGGFVVRDEGEIEADLLGFARTSLDLLERLKADRNIVEPLVAATH